MGGIDSKLLFQSLLAGSIFVFIFVVTHEILRYFKRKAIRKERELEKQRALENKKKVLEFSSRLNLIREMNQKYCFEDIDCNQYYTVSVDTKLKLDNFNFDQYMGDLIYDYQDFFLSLIKKTERNRKQYELYAKEIMQRFPRSIKADAEKCGLSEDVFIQIEKPLLEEESKKPVLKMSIHCKATYKSPKGRNTYKRDAEYSIEDISRLYKEVMKRDTRKAQMQRERSLVTPKLRYMVLQRDGRRCKICGRSEADGAKLHVDHIIPISKGGKTEMDNLQTLCDYCNIGKGNSYEPPA